MTNLFVYGSLMNQEVWFPLLQTKVVSIEARLSGYYRESLQGCTYPAIRIQADSSVDGLVLLDLSAFQIEVLDSFEGELYQRESVVVNSVSDDSLECETYSLKPSYYHLMSGKAWDNNTFRKQHMYEFINEFSA